MDWYEDEVRKLESAIKERKPPRDVVAFYGSSSIRQWSTLAADFPGLNVINLGFGGSTMAACAHFFPRLVSPVQPRCLVLYAGDNDLGDGKSPDDVLSDFRSLVSQFQAALPSARLAFLSIKASPARWHLEDVIEKTNRLVAAELAEWKDSHYVDVHSPMLAPDGKPRTELYAADGLHLSPAGYRCWKEILIRDGSIFLTSSSGLHSPHTKIGEYS